MHVVGAERISGLIHNVNGFISCVFLRSLRHLY